VILYYSPQTRAFPVLWTLEELAVEYELKIVNLKQAEQKKDEYRRLNPMMKVPALTDGDVVVTETGAILQYLAEKNSPPCLLAQLGDATRSTCIWWLFFVGSNFEPAMGERFNGWTPNPYYNGWGDFDRVRDVIGCNRRSFDRRILASRRMLHGRRHIPRVGLKNCVRGQADLC
jgi:glutathione S-transferase